MEKPKILLLEFKQREAHYKDLMRCFDADYLISNGPSEDVFEKEEIDLTICADEWVPETSLNVFASKKNQVPVLHLPDGILEWRNNYEHPRAFSQKNGMPLHQPHLADKIACLGRNQARMMEAWGSAGKCEVVGCARFDQILAGGRPRQRSEKKTFKILVATARIPAFTAEQKALVDRSIQDLAVWFYQVNYKIADTDIEVVWRVSDEYEDLLSRSGSFNFSKKALYDELSDVDAVVTTPSTLMLEAMLFNVPVVLMDYTNSPHFTPAIWNITAPRHIPSVMPELISPSKPKMLHQEIILHDCLECSTPAIERLSDLVKSMIEIAHKCKIEGKPISFPDRIIPISPHVGAVPASQFDLKKLYLGHPVFSCNRIEELQSLYGQSLLLIEKQRQMFEEQSRKFRDLEKDLEKILETRSWRITKPLRILGQILAR